MIAIFILTLSLILQFVAVFLALRLIKVTGRSLAWGLIAAAIMLMAIRRLISLAEFFVNGVALKPDLYAELVALLISILMVAGIARITPVFAEIKKKNDRLAESEERYRTLFECAPDAIIIADLDSGQIVDVNSHAVSLTGRSRKELVGMHQSRLHPSNIADYTRTSFESHVEQARSGIVSDPFEHVVVRAGGTEVPVEITVQMVEAGGRELIQGIFRDISERKQVERKLRESELAFRMLAENSPDVIVRYDRDGRRIYVNPEFERVNHLSAEQVIGKTPQELSTELKPQADVFTEKLMAAMQSGQVAKIDLTWQKDGTPVWWFVRIVPEFDASGSVTSALTIWSDVTERGAADMELRARERDLMEAQRIAHLGSWHMNLTTNEVYWSEQLYKMYGYDPALPPPLYTDSMKLFTPESWERLSSSIARCAETGTSYELELEMVPKGGGTAWMLARGELVRDEHGAAVQIRGVVMDITERKLAENDLREKEERLTLATIQNGVGIWDWNLKTQEMIWDDSMYALYHIRREDFSGTEEAWRASLHPDDLERGDREVADAIAGKKPFETEFRVVWPNGEIHYIKAVAKVFRDEQGTPLRMLGINMDITERKKAESALRDLYNDFVTLLENSGDFIYFKDKDSRIRFCSQTMANITGHHSWRDMIGKHDLEIFPEDTARIYYEEELPIFIEGKPILNKMDPYYDDQGKQRWVNTNKWPVFGEDNQTVVGIFGISRDVTELKMAEDEINALNRGLEKRVAERTEQLEAANKELESFSYSVSHDLRTPLRAIDGFSHILLDDYADKLDDEGKRLLNVVRDNTVRMGQLIDDILQFSRTGRLALAFVEIDMEALAREVVEELRPLGVVEKDKLQLIIEPLPRAIGDRAMMRQVFVNLLSNAIKFSQYKETPTIRVGASPGDDEAIYYVKDNGAGFDMQFSNKLFGVFQRLHSVSEFEGTGIGLAIVKRIVTRHGGRVWAEGKINEGATIYFALPSRKERNG